MPDSSFNPLLGGTLAGGIGVLVAFYFGYKRRLKIGVGSRMGLNLSTDLACPNCHSLLPIFRRPKNFRQMMWGGFSCEKCGKEFDKWLKPIGLNP